MSINEANAKLLEEHPRAFWSQGQSDILEGPYQFDLVYEERYNLPELEAERWPDQVWSSELPNMTASEAWSLIPETLA
jgi:hypothetical protein